MWDWISDAAGAAWDFIKGAGSDLFQTVKWLLNRILGSLDFLLTLLGIMPWKKITVQATILLDEKEPVADRDDVQSVVDLAADVFADEMNVRLISPAGLVTILPEPAPSYALEVSCGSSIFGAQFTQVGAWFRARCARSPAGTLFGYGSPITVFVVRDIEGKRGCSVGFLADYVVLDPDALAGAEGRRLTLAHEVGHGCDLWHDDGTLMQSGHSGRPRSLSRYQKAIFRSSPHVTYL